MDEAQQAVLGSLAAQMFAEPIATGEVIVTDPAPEPVQVPVQVAPTAPAAPVAVETPAPDVPAAEAPEPVSVPESVPTFKPKLDDELQAFLDEPDFEEEARQEVAAEVESDEYEYESDPETTAKARAQEKRIQFLEGQLVAKSKRGWVEEAKRAFPDLARLIPGEIEAIDATSRRGFLREAAKRNDRYATALGPTLARLEAERAAIAAGAVQVARDEVATAWGKPAADTLPPMAAAQQEALAKARQEGGLEGAIKELMKTQPVL